jgi:hypothetical protein
MRRRRSAAPARFDRLLRRGRESTVVSLRASRFSSDGFSHRVLDPLQLVTVTSGACLVMPAVRARRLLARIGAPGHRA